MKNGNHLNLENARNAYDNDPAFHHLVCTLERLIIDLQLTPDEVRAAAMFACIQVRNMTQELIVYLPNPNITIGDHNA